MRLSFLRLLLLLLAMLFFRLQAYLFFGDYFFRGDYFRVMDSFGARKSSYSSRRPLTYGPKFAVLLLIGRREEFLSDSGIRSCTPKLNSFDSACFKIDLLRSDVFYSLSYACSFSILDNLPMNRSYILLIL